jgi:hypothetical protein
VLAARLRLLGEEHPDTLTSMHNVASTLSSQGDLAGARALQERVLAARLRQLGQKHPDTSGSAWNLVLTLLKAKQTEAAKDVFSACLAWLRAADNESLSADQRTVRRNLEGVAHLVGK